jgi:hypothetical protein
MRANNLYRGAALLAAVLVALAFAQFPKTPSPVIAQTSPCPANPSPPNAADPSIIVERPSAGARVTSPVQVSGRARVFEAQVSITIYDGSARPIVNTFTMAREGGVLSPFSASVAFTVAREQAGCIRVFETSARDGSPINVVQIPVTLATMTPPGTGSGGLLGPDSSTRDDWLIALAGALAFLGSGATLVALRRH